MPLATMNTVNTPDRLSLDSFADPDRPNQAAYSSFTNQLGVAVLNAKQLHLLRATIPNVTLQLPDYSLVFFYYQLPSNLTPPIPFYLRAVRLYPSDYVPPSGFTAFTRNSFYNTPSDLVTALNAAATTGGDNATYNRLWTLGAASFSYSSTTSKISFTGTNPSFFYAIAGWNDPNVLAVVNNFVRTVPSQVVTNGSTTATFTVSSTVGMFIGSPITVTGCSNPSLNGTFTLIGVSDTTLVISSALPAATALFTNGSITSTPNMLTTYNFDTSTSIQPMVSGVTLNQRLGYGLSGTCVPPQSFGAQISNLIANLTGKAVQGGVGLVVNADTFPCLVYTQCIYLYANVVGNTGLGNYGRKNLLAVVAVDKAPFGVIQFIGSYNGGEAHPLPDEIYSFNIEMRDDNNMPFLLPDTANVNVEIAIDYGLPPYL